MPAYAQLLVIVVALVAFWAIVMRPARNQQRKVQTLQHELAVGDEVVISAGIFGTVRSVDVATLELEVAPGMVLKVARQVVVRRADAAAEADEETGAADDAAPQDTNDLNDLPESPDRGRPQAED